MADGNTTNVGPNHYTIDAGNSGSRSSSTHAELIDSKTIHKKQSLSTVNVAVTTLRSSRSFSKILPSTSIAAFADAVEMDVVQRLSKSHLMAEDVIEIIKMRDVSRFKKAKEDVEQSHPTSGKSHFAIASIEKIMEEFSLQDLNHGLSSSQVVINRGIYGKNVLDTGKSDPLWRIYISQFCSFVVALLLAAAVASISLGNHVEGIFIILITNINAGLATYMEKSAANVLEKLAEMSSPTCTVIRDGVSTVLDSKCVVPGDVIVLKMGDTVAADVRLFDIKEIRVNESLLTGESVSVKKALVAADLDSPFSSNLCFASTSVVAGSAKAIVINIGMETQVGKIAKQLKKASESGKLTPLQRGINRLGGLIGIISAFVLVTIVIVAVVTGYEDPTRPDTSGILSIVLLAVGFAVSSIPEGLPMVVTISLSLGAKDMATKNANIRKLPAVETLGCCSIICSDKTGTLTEGKMTATTIVSFRCENDKLASRKHFFFPTCGFNPIGGVFEPSHLTDEFKTNLLSRIQKTGHLNDVDKNITRKGAKSIDALHIRTTLLSAYLNSYATSVKRDERSGRWISVGNMTEGPLIVAAAKCNLGSALNPFDTTMTDYERIDALEIPFNSSRKMMCTVHKLKVSNFFGELDLSKPTDGVTFTHVATLKGAPDMLFDKCRMCIKSCGSGKISLDWDTISAGLTEADFDVIFKSNDELSSKALRVLLLGIFPLTDMDIATLEKCEDSDSRLNFLLGNGNEYSVPLVFLGFVGSLDPPRNGVREAISTCTRAGIRVIMITGDQQATASAVARDIGLFNQQDNSDLSKTALECRCLHVNNDHTKQYLPDHVLDEYTSKVSVFCRAQPEDKVAIVESLRRQEYLTAMTGDGVNDAPALKTADIGVAMGINGTDVAKGASEMVLLDDNFCTIVSAVESGRTIYANIQKFVSFLLGTNIGEILYLTASIAMRILPPVEALQILFLNFMTDGCPAVALSREPADENTMSQKPRPPKQPIMTRDWWIYGNLPHTIFESCCVIMCIVCALYLCTGAIFLNDLHSQCRHVTLKNSKGESFDFPYFCKTYEYRILRDYVGWVTHINYFDVKKGKMVTVLGAAKGKVETLTPTTEGLHPNVKESFDNLTLEDISDYIERDENGWFKSKFYQTLPVDDDEKSVTLGAAPRGFHDISGRKAMQARTMSFITAVWCEMLRAYTVRSWDYFYNVFNRNPWMHVACSISATSTFLITIIPRLNHIMHVTSLEWWQYLLSVVFALLSLILDELIPKFLYRRKAALREQAEKSKTITTSQS